MRDWVKNRRGQPEKLKNTGQTYIMIEKCETLDMLEWAIERARAAPAPADEKPGDSILCSGCFAKGVGPEHFDEAGKCLVRQQTEPLGAEFAQVLSDNLPELLSTEQELDPLNLAPHAEAFNEAPAEALKPEQAEAERPKIVATLFTPNEKVHDDIGFKAFAVAGDCDKDGGEFYDPEKLMTVAQHERIVGELRAVIAQLRQHKNDYMDSGQETYRALQNEIREREAEIARLDGLVSGRTAERDAALAEVERLRQFERICEGLPQDAIDGGWTVQGIRGYAKRLEDQLKSALARVAELERKLRNEENAHTTTIEQRDNAEHWADQLANAIAERFGVDIGEHSNLNCPWNEALVWMQQPPAQAQHSVPEGWRIERSAERIVVMNLKNGAGYAAARDGESGIAESVLYLLAADLLAAAPGKEGV
ncbi:TPA: hypothetical protein NOT24_001124 [Pseudomonas aeruginosa]|nr:hypothetical protein [Pseudomonas aeruginosa]